MNGANASSEAWLPIAGFEGIYEISDQGTVKRLGGTKGARNDRILSPYTSGFGYLTVSLSRENERTRRTVHSLVAEAFIGPRPQGLQVRHLDGTKENNCKENLKYGTPLENSADLDRHGARRSHFGERTHCSRGHAYTEANTRIKVRSSGAKERVCRTCARERYVPVARRAH